MTDTKRALGLLTRRQFMASTAMAAAAIALPVGLASRPAYGVDLGAGDSTGMMLYTYNQDTDSWDTVCNVSYTHVDSKTGHMVLERVG